MGVGADEQGSFILDDGAGIDTDENDLFRLGILYVDDVVVGKREHHLGVFAYQSIARFILLVVSGESQKRADIIPCHFFSSSRK